MRKRNSAIVILSFCFAVALTSTIWGIRHRGSAFQPAPEPLNWRSDSTPPKAAAGDGEEHPQPQIPDPAPVFGWVKARTESFVLDPGQAVAYPVQMDEVANAGSFAPI